MPDIHSRFLLIIILSFTIVMRLIELRLARRNQQQRTSAILVRERFYFLFFILHPLFLLCVPLEAYLQPTPFSPILASISLVGLICCFALRIHILTILKENWNIKILYEEQSNHGICTQGIYQYIRHPNYLIVILEIIFIALFHSCFFSLISFSLFNGVVLFIRIRNEEKALMKNAYYAQHFKDKKRFIPGIF